MLDVGKRAPSFALPGIPEKTYRLADYKGQFVVLYFYPKDDTPTCTTEACDFRDNWKRITAAGAVVLGVSADPPKKHTKFGQKFELPFPLLSDEDHAVCDKYGVWGEKQLYGRTFLGIHRTTFLIGPGGKIAFVWENVRVKGHVEAVLETLQSLASEAG